MHDLEQSSVYCQPAGQEGASCCFSSTRSGARLHMLIKDAESPIWLRVAPLLPCGPKASRTKRAAVRKWVSVWNCAIYLQRLTVCSQVHATQVAGEHALHAYFQRHCFSMRSAHGRCMAMDSLRRVNAQHVQQVVASLCQEEACLLLPDVATCATRSVLLRLHMSPSYLSAYACQNYQERGGKRTHSCCV